MQIILEAGKGNVLVTRASIITSRNAIISPRPYQQPHPPIRMAATTEETFLRVGEKGLPIFVGLRGMDIPELRVTCRPTARPGMKRVILGTAMCSCVSRSMPRRPSRERWKNLARVLCIILTARRTSRVPQSDVPGTGPAERRQARAERMTSLSYEEILHTKVAFGTAAGLIDRLAQLREELGLDGVVAELDSGGQIPPEQVKRSLQILTHEVMPAFK